MNRRILPCLTWSGGDIVKTKQFTDAAYVGDVFNLVRIFSEKEADELIFLDIDATPKGRGPDLGLVEDVAAGCTVPLTYGGGITTVEQIGQVIYRGVEKVMIGSAALAHPQLIRDAVDTFGSSTIAVCIDYASDRSMLRKGSRRRKKILSPDEAALFAKQVAEIGAGEIVLHAADRDGMGVGYDIAFLQQMALALLVPVTALGGAGREADITALFAASAVSAAASGNAMIYYGPHKAVLPSYRKTQDAMFAMPVVAHDF